MKSILLNPGPPKKHLLVFDVGDEIVSSLVAFAKQQELTAAHFEAIGALREGVIAYWDWNRKEYDRIEVGEQVEVVSCIGNIGRGADGEPKVHAHIALGRKDGSLIGGHLMEGRVRPTLELVLVESSATIQRRRDDLTGLELIEA